MAQYPEGKNCRPSGPPVAFSPPVPSEDEPADTTLHCVACHTPNYGHKAHIYGDDCVGSSDSPTTSLPKADPSSPDLPRATPVPPEVLMPTVLLPRRRHAWPSDLVSQDVLDLNQAEQFTAVPHSQDSFQEVSIRELG